MDRNKIKEFAQKDGRWSPSSRRAWIEIIKRPYSHEYAYVALLAEGVDRNSNQYGDETSEKASPSSRRAWIEISKLLVNILPLYVALLAEGVDRNFLV